MLDRRQWTFKFLLLKSMFMPQLGRSQLFGRIEVKVFGEINRQAEIGGCLQY